MNPGALNTEAQIKGLLQSLKENQRKLRHPGSNKMSCHWQKAKACEEEYLLPFKDLWLQFAIGSWTTFYQDFIFRSKTSFAKYYLFLHLFTHLFRLRSYNIGLLLYE